MSKKLGYSVGETILLPYYISEVDNDDQTFRIDPANELEDIADHQGWMLEYCWLSEEDLDLLVSLTDKKKRKQSLKSQIEKLQKEIDKLGEDE